MFSKSQLFSKPQSSRPIIIRLVCIGLILLSSHLQAAELTAKSIKTWADSLSDISAWAKRYEFDPSPEETARDSVMPDLREQVSHVLYRSKGHPHYQELLKQLRARGYADGDEWAATGDRILAAYTALQLSGEQQQIEQSLKQAKSMLKNMDLGPEQAVMMKNMMSRSEAQLKGLKQVPEADLAAVKAQQKMLEKAFESME